jgi:hypothetical protein
MITLEMNEEEAKLLLSVLDRYMYHLQIEIAHTHKRAFREALKESEVSLKSLIDKLKGLIA